MMTPKDKKEAQMAAKVKAEAATCRFTKGALVKSMPCMPVLSGERTWPHRQKLSESLGLEGLAVVARSVRPKELKTNPKAQAAMDKVSSALRELGA